MKIIDIKDVDILECEDEVFKVKTSSKEHELKTFKSLKKFDDIKEELYDYCREEVQKLENENYYLDWRECCDKAREKMKEEGLTEDDDEDFFMNMRKTFGMNLWKSM